MAVSRLFSFLADFLLGLWGGFPAFMGWVVCLYPQSSFHFFFPVFWGFFAQVSNRPFLFFLGHFLPVWVAPQSVRPQGALGDGAVLHFVIAVTATVQTFGTDGLDGGQLSLFHVSILSCMAWWRFRAIKELPVFFVAYQSSIHHREPHPHGVGGKVGVSFYILYNIYDTHIFSFQPFDKITYKS